MEKLLSIMSNLQSHCNSKLHLQKLDQHKDGKWFFVHWNRAISLTGCQCVTCVLYISLSLKCFKVWYVQKWLKLSGESYYNVSIDWNGILLLSK